MGEDYYVTEEERIRQEIEKEEKKAKKKKSKGRKILRICVIIGLFLVAAFVIYYELCKGYGVKASKALYRS